MQVTAIRQRGVMVAIAAACLAMSGRADDALEWLGVTADDPVDHRVMIRGPFHEAHEQVSLAGPVALVVAGHEAEAGTCFTVYAVTMDGDESARIARVGTENAALRLGPPAFLLVPAKRLSEGPPAGGPRVVYEVRPILDPPAAAAAPPTHLCLPVDYRHHFERLPVEEPGRGLVIFAPRADASPAAAVRTVDDFGLNRLVPGGEVRAAAWTPVHPAD